MKRGGLTFILLWILLGFLLFTVYSPNVFARDCAPGEESTPYNLCVPPIGDSGPVDGADETGSAGGYESGSESYDPVQEIQTWYQETQTYYDEQLKKIQEAEQELNDLKARREILSPQFAALKAIYDVPAGKQLECLYADTGGIWEGKSCAEWESEAYDAAQPMNKKEDELDEVNQDITRLEYLIPYDKEYLAELAANVERAKKELDDAQKEAAQQDTQTADGTGTPSYGGLADELEPEFNTNSDRGRDEFGRMNPNMGGYLGDAYVERSDGTKVIPGHELYLNVKDKVITGKDAKVNIIFSDAGRINLGPNTELRVGNALLDQYYLARGTLKSKIKLLDTQKFEIDTPNAGIFSKGTEFIVNYNETTNTTEVVLKEGKLEIYSAKYVLNLSAGYYCMIYPNGEMDYKKFMSGYWESLGGNFYKDETEKMEDAIAYWIKVYTWITLIVIVIFALIFVVFGTKSIAKAKLQQKDKNKKDLSRLALILGILGIITALWPIIGYPFSMIAIWLSTLQKLRKPTRTAAIGRILGIIGGILSFIAFLSLVFNANLFN
ncbi:MAG: FecR domain-containing protein [archaeon]